MSGRVVGNALRHEAAKTLLHSPGRLKNDLCRVGLSGLLSAMKQTKGFYTALLLLVLLLLLLLLLVVVCCCCCCCCCGGKDILPFYISQLPIDRSAAVTGI